MKYNMPMPEKKLSWFREKLGIDQNELKKLEQYRDFFIARKRQFSTFFFEYFSAIEETGFLLEHHEGKGNLKRIWMEWFELLFKSGFDHRFLTYLWKSGLRHVEINIDHRFIALSYSIVRQFCQKIVKEEIPAPEQESVLTVIDKMVDFCLLIETHAFIEATSRCDMEVVKGISHQVRNPLMVIGGNALRLLKSMEKGSTESSIQRICETIIEENKRLENMVNDASIYSDMYQKETQYSLINLEGTISGAIKRLMSVKDLGKVEIELDIQPKDTMVYGDREDLETMFYYLLQNSLEALDPENPLIKICLVENHSPSSFIEIEVFNSGAFPEIEEIDNLFVPFYSSKPLGTGFGIPIAQLAARRSLGDIYIKPVPNEGTRCVVKLPLA